MSMLALLNLDSKIHNTCNKTKTSLAIILFTVFLDILGFSLLIPVLPLILTNPQSGSYLFPAGFDSGSALLIYGVLMGILPLFSFFFAPILGQLSDKYGRHIILFWSLVGTFFAYCILAGGIAIKSLPLIFLARIVGGIAGGNISVANTVVSDISTDSLKSRNFAWVSASYGLGLILGSYIGGQLSSSSIVSWFDATTPFWFASIVSFINAILVYFYLPETNQYIQKYKILKWNESILELFKALRYKSSVQTILVISFLFQAGFSFISSFASPFFGNKYNWTGVDIGNFFGYVGICVAITQVFLVHIVSKQFGDKKVLQFSLYATAFSIFTLFLPSTTLGLYFLIPFFAIFSGLATANISTLVSSSATKEKQGEIIGINSGLQSLAQAIPAIVSGFLSFEIESIAHRFGYNGNHLALASPVFLAMITVLLAGIYMHKNKEFYRTPTK